MKTVAHIIQVPTGTLCWEGTMQGDNCNYFDNEGGHADCQLGFYNTYDKRLGVYKKGKHCLALKEHTDE